jgi:hypothetical protein
MHSHPEGLRGPEQRDTDRDYAIARRAMAIAEQLGSQIAGLTSYGADSSSVYGIADELEAEILFRISTVLDLDKNAWKRAAKDQ